MDDPDGGLSFDFEGGLDAAVPAAPVAGSASLMPSEASGNAGVVGVTGAPGDPSVAMAGGGAGRRSFRQTVCRHWLRSLCMKGDACGFLHQYDKSRMPVCRFYRLYGECREQDCVYKHTNEDIKECNMYKMGFCPNGPDCRYRHAKLPGPPPSVEEVLQKIQHLSSFGYGSSNKFFQHRNNGYTQSEKPQFSQGSAAPNQVTPVNSAVTLAPPNAQQTQSQPQQSQQQQASQVQAQNPLNGSSNQVNRIASPLPQGQSRYFIVKSCNRENLEISVQQGVWATQRSNEAKLNEAFESSENVILIFSINRTQRFQGCAKMTSKIGGFIGGGNWKYAHGTAHYGRNFSIKWLKLCELSFHKTRHLRNPYNDNLPVKISRDCQELEPFIGEQLASLLYLEPDSELMAMFVAAEAKREEEKAKGVTADAAADNQDIVLYEDNEEEEEEESEEEDESFNQAVQGRGRGRGMPWQPPMPMIRGGRPMLSGFPPAMMGADGFGFGPVAPDGFATPDLFGMPPRVFGPFGGPAGMGFPARPAQPGAMFPMGSLGMMMGAGRTPFMGGMNMARANRPIGVAPFLHPPPPPLNNRIVKKDQKRLVGDQGSKGQDSSGGAGGEDDDRFQSSLKSQHEGKYSVDNEESESEDEAPRRSRHGEGKRKRRGSQGESASDQWETPLA
ncbi:cleavage and polyadenylation specificity factor subunit 4 protein [Dioscorea alata]|uniref:Cleavage and polyadenylation specificity factor subunit 4 protein n=1 Tax=Dioscorea alata TaxID=55571 RepID=A0ACB7U264_DIOAL|nr:cleavage and polyadenylation specificity factor subunit 4 protein [Dioscorea alata]